MKWKYEHVEEKMPLCMSKCTQEKKTYANTFTKENIIDDIVDK
jgi:hypothetical protein